MRVLILEDSRHRADRLRLALAGHDVVHAVTSHEAMIAVCEAGPFDLLLLDHDLGVPGWTADVDTETGLAFAKGLAAHWPDPKPAVVIHALNPLGARRMTALLDAMWWPFSAELLEALGRPLQDWYVPIVLPPGGDLGTLEPAGPSEEARAWLKGQLRVIQDRETLRTTNLTFAGSYVNTPDEVLAANISSSIRRGYPQVQADDPKPDRVCLVGGGPSLLETLPELVDLAMSGAKIVALNHAYTWCLEQHLRPSAHVMLDARPINERFVGSPVPQCLYLYASQCHPSVWDAIDGRERVCIWHACTHESAEAPILDAYYGRNRWLPIPGGTSVATRAIMLLRTVGYFRFDLFGIDSCWLDGVHHAWGQPENLRDKQIPVHIAPADHPELGADFLCAPWHLKQIEDFLQVIRVNGQHFLLNVHGRGLLGAVLRQGATVSAEEPVSVPERV